MHMRMYWNGLEFQPCFYPPHYRCFLLSGLSWLTSLDFWKNGFLSVKLFFLIDLIIEAWLLPSLAARRELGGSSEERNMGGNWHWSRRSWISQFSTVAWYFFYTIILLSISIPNIHLSRHGRYPCNVLPNYFGCFECSLEDQVPDSLLSKNFIPY